MGELPRELGIWAACAQYMHYMLQRTLPHLNYSLSYLYELKRPEEPVLSRLNFPREKGHPSTVKPPLPALCWEVADLGDGNRKPCR